jgi:FAD/FMN-containing dehydrogenase
MISVKTNDGRNTQLSPEALEAYRGGLRGAFCLPGDPGYDEARTLWNAMIDRHPAAVVRAASAADVMRTVRLASEHKLLLAVRGGGHNIAGNAVCEGGLMLDLSLMKSIRVNPGARTARVEPGARLADLDRESQAFGLAVPVGINSTTGVAGLTLGGGFGWLSRKHGLTIDNLISADVVTAKGELLHASASANADLFWAIRGGGGNFGVVTSFLFRGHPVQNVYGGPIFWPIDKGPELLRFWRDFIEKAPEDINGWFGFATVPPVPMFPAEHHLKKVAVVTWCYTGDIAKADQVFKPIRQFSPPLMDFCGPIPFPVLQSLFDGLYPAGLQWYWKADFFQELSEKAIDLHVKYGERLPSPHSTMHIYPINGAAQRVGKEDTAFSFRDARFAEVIVGVDPDPANNPRLMQWAKDYWLALHPFSSGGGYINMMMDEGEDNVKAAYRDNYARLAQVKRKYDPGNLFRVNQNIKPT